MSEDSRNLTDTDAESEEKRRDVRTPKTVRFSDPEWQLVENAAIKRGVPVAEYVRTVTLDAAEGKFASNDAVLTPGHVALLERTYRSVYILSTLKRDEMIHEGRGNEMDTLVKVARKSQISLLSNASE